MVDNIVHENKTEQISINLRLTQTERDELESVERYTGLNLNKISRQLFSELIKGNIIIDNTTEDGITVQYK